MADDLSDHRPSESARKRAEAAGLDLATLRRDDPTTYRMLCAVPLLTASSELRAAAQAPLHAAFPDQELFEAESGERLLILAFPGPDAEALEVFDRLMGESAELETHRHGYYRVVRDRRGTHREFDLPTPPGAWQGEDTMVGPFDDEAAASRWGEERASGPGRTYDTVPYAGAWFCDVFGAEE